VHREALRRENNSTDGPLSMIDDRRSMERRERTQLAGGPPVASLPGRIGAFDRCEIRVSTKRVSNPGGYHRADFGPRLALPSRHDASRRSGVLLFIVPALPSRHRIQPASSAATAPAADQKLCSECDETAPARNATFWRAIFPSSPLFAP